jgi:hypothetical protein
MFVQKPDLLRASALLVSLCLLQTYALAAPDSVASLAVQSPGGTFRTTNNQPIFVNGNEVRPGTTIMSGSVITTPRGVLAFLRLGASELEVAPGSELVVNFDAEGNATASLRSGCAALRGGNRLTGSITTPDGATKMLDEAGAATVCYGDGESASPVVQGGTQGGTQGSTGGLRRALLAVLIAGGAGAAVLAVILANRGGDPSPSQP